MDPVFRVMCDVTGLVTRGSDAARMETQRMAAERERRAAAQTALLPASIVAVGGPEQPVERLMTLQSAIARAVHMASGWSQFRIRLPRGRLLGFRLRDRSAATLSQESGSQGVV